MRLLAIIFMNQDNLTNKHYCMSCEFVTTCIVCEGPTSIQYVPTGSFTSCNNFVPCIIAEGPMPIEPHHT